jgi:hypothetical protein
MDSDEVRTKFDFVAFQVDGITEIDDTEVVGIGDRQGEADFPGNAFVSSGGSERDTVKDISSGRNLDADYARIKRRTGHRQQEEQTPPSHAPKHNMRLIN